MRKLRVLISGGGTGGHIFPALSIANCLRDLCPESEFLFIGAEGKMEMEKVPAAGYRIVGLPIVGLQRRLTVRNILNDLTVPFRWVASMAKARKTIKSFRPDIAIGVGGYASAAALKEAHKLGIPCLLQEQNSFAGLSNRMLAKGAEKICVAYEGMERFFPAEKLVMTGNPIRKDIVPPTAAMREEGLAYYGLDPTKKHIFIVGGSLGSGTLNASMRRWISDSCPGSGNVEVLWQCGKYYKAGTDAFMAEHKTPNVHYTDFIGRMDLAYAVADLVISRAGASTVSELCAAGKAAIFVPSPNVAEDHQTHNAMALVDKGAAMIVKDSEAVEKLMAMALEALADNDRLSRMSRAISSLALPDAALAIAKEVYKIVDSK